ncbi:hypothetical protein V8G54_005480 [Vigna mungo]|uniref:Uncharacterized protein n=1 Tax=Vigna mungo TaxID=3915 RepID=A0AAQ3P1L3_VIGMU
MAVQRQSAASKSAKSLITAQQSLVGGIPTIMFTSPKTLPQTPSFRVSIGQEAGGGGVGVGGVGGQPLGEGGGLTFGLGFGVGGGLTFGVGGVGAGGGLTFGLGFGVGGVGAGFGVGGVGGFGGAQS